MKTFEQAFEEAKRENEINKTPGVKTARLIGGALGTITGTVIFCLVTTTIFYFISKALLLNPLEFKEIGFAVLFFDYLLNVHMRK